MTLNDLLLPYLNDKLPDSLSAQVVNSLTNDSRRIVSGCVFLAARGLSSHALEHLTLTQAEQTSAIIYEPDYDTSRLADYTDKLIAVDNLHQYIGDIGKAFYHPHFNAPLIGVTGTNGKTSVTQFISQLSDYAFIGTTGYGRSERVTPLTHTTPDALQTQSILQQLSTQASGVVMEVSSHALCQHRVDAVDFGIAIFTNLSQDHLDFHRDMEDYFQAKCELFTPDCVQTAVINTDDEYGYRLAQKCQDQQQRVIAFGQQSRCESFTEYARIRDIHLSQQGINATISLNVGDIQTEKALLSPVWGAFNAYNIVAAQLALFTTGISIHTLFNKTQQLHGVRGRIEPIALGDNKTAIIDYAHTPDALKNTLLSLRKHLRSHAKKYATNTGKIYTVFGCGGDRDKAKRPLMAQAVSEYSDFGIITDDNPRTETSQAIIDDMLAGNIESLRFQVIPSRREAIEFGLSHLSPNDVLLIAGKGHEDYQIIGSEKIHFSDHEVVQEWLS